jgi:hypothetical protein
VTPTRSIDGLTPDAQLDVTRIRARRMFDRAYRLLTETLLPELDRTTFVCDGGRSSA